MSSVKSANNSVGFSLKLPALLVGFCVLAGSFSAGSADNTLPITPEHFNNLGVTLGKLTAVKQVPLLYAPAKVVIPPTHDFIVSTSQAGLITRLSAAIGDKVKKGQVLAMINSPDLLTLQSQYLNAKNTLNLASTSYSRDKKLLSEGVIADRRAQETSSQYSSALFHANEAKQLLEIAGMSAGDIDNLDKTQKLNSQLNVRAPITGIVLEKMTVAGTRIDNLAPLYRIGILDELWLEINIPQEHLAGIKPGDQVLIENTPIQAQISMLGQSVNPENQTILARALVKGEQNSVRPGQKLNIQIVQASDKTAFKIPDTGIAQNEGKSFIFIRNRTGFLVSAVNIIGKQDAESIITGNLSGNEEIAINGAVALKANWLGLGSSE